MTQLRAPRTPRIVTAPFTFDNIDEELVEVEKGKKTQLETKTVVSRQRWCPHCNNNGHVVIDHSDEVINGTHYVDAAAPCPMCLVGRLRNSQHDFWGGKDVTRYSWDGGRRYSDQVCSFCHDLYDPANNASGHPSECANRERERRARSRDLGFRIGRQRITKQERQLASPEGGVVRSRFVLEERARADQRREARQQETQGSGAS